MGGWRSWAQPPSGAECVLILVFSALIIVGASYPPELSSMMFTASLFCGGLVWAPLVILYVLRVIAWRADRPRRLESGGESESRNWRRWIPVPVFLTLILSICYYPWPMVLRFTLCKGAFDQAAREVRAGTFSVPRWVGLYHVTSVTIEGSDIDFITNDSFIDPAGFSHRPNSAWVPYARGPLGMSVAADWCTVEH